MIGLKLPLLIILGYLLPTSPANAFFFDSKQAVYNCKSEEDAKQCNQSCSAVGKDIEFKVDLKQRKILLTYYENGRPIGSSVEKKDTYTDCDIFDEKNWTCTTLSPGTRNYPGVHSISSMSGGKYLYRSYTSGKFFACTR